MSSLVRNQSGSQETNKKYGTKEDEIDWLKSYTSRSSVAGKVKAIVNRSKKKNVLTVNNAWVSLPIILQRGKILII